MTYKKTPKQIELIKLCAKYITVLAEGGSRSGKTFGCILIIVCRALIFPNTDHVVFRKRFNAVKRSIWLGTLPTVLKLMGIYKAAKWNNEDFFVTLHNGSRIWIGGLDDKERTDKILGMEFSTIYLNEASEISFDSYEVTRTRLNPPKGVPALFLIDYNPPNQSHWGFKVFHKRQLPDGTPVPDTDFVWIKMNPMDNSDNLSETYITTLNSLSARKKKRFLDGEYGEDSGRLWNRDIIRYARIDGVSFVRVVIGVDPSGSATGDAVGIVVVGMTAEGKLYVLEDRTMQGSPKEWSDEVFSAYEKWQCDCIAAEKNFGGDMVETTLTDMGRRFIAVKLVNASRGKIVRAEPVVQKYEKYDVFHVEQFVDMEDEMCSYKGDGTDDDSPNRMDALVWAITELSTGRASILDAVN